MSLCLSFVTLTWQLMLVLTIFLNPVDMKLDWRMDMFQCV